MTKFSKNDIMSLLVQSIFILIGSLFIALSLYMFTIPAKFAPGGLSGLASIIEIVFDFSASYSILIFNVPLIVLSFVFLSRPFAIKTSVTVVLVSGVLKLFELVKLYQFIDPSNLILSALAGGLIYGVGIGLLLNSGSSSGGTEIISMLIRKKVSSISISWIIFIINVAIVAFGGVLYLTVLKLDYTYVLALILYSIIQNFTASKSIEFVIKGVSSSVKIEIITTKPAEICEEINNKTKRGVTVISSKGGHSGEDNTVIICVVYRTEIRLIKHLIKQIDPSCFAFAMDTREVWGNGFQ